jgi:hypothetical protein
MDKPAEIRWIQLGVVGGICASVLYPMLIFAPLPLTVAASLAAFLGPAIGISSLGLFKLIRVYGYSVAAALGTIHNVVAGGMLTAMLLVQLAIRMRPVPFSQDLVGVWAGLDVAWDVYIGLGTLFFAFSMLRHPRFRWPFAVSGILIGLLLLVLNLLTFPDPPSQAGSVDVGPFLGAWYLIVTVQMWRSLPWALERLGTISDGRRSGSVDLNT